VNPLLEHWLGYAYGAAISGREERIELVRGVLREKFAADDGLRAAAREELARIEALAAACGGPHMLHNRCYVSAVHRNTLLSVLD
jgi:hypothetical protein